ncbi:MFS transporter [Candidatus Laterigemmans baculatus]|uniref:MFS transporter n=1 Tax=Candidatus Laterigemmans baculatus TaxID=2770505 RepID=UPI0013DD57D8|nr:MFS transporter [Candidatus Laterigemmans baculatus]
MADAPLNGDALIGETPTYRRYGIFWLAATTSFLLYLHRYTWNLVRPELQAEYGLSNTALEAMGSAFFFPYAAGQVPGGILCDLFGPHLFLVAIIVLWSICLPLHGLLGNYTALLFVRGGFGLAQAGCYPALSQVTRAWFPQRSRTAVQGWIASGFGRGGGAMASLIMGTLLMAGLGLSWKAALLVLGGVGVAFGLLFLLLFRNSPQQDPLVNDAERALISAGAHTESTAKRVLPFRTALANPSFLLLLTQQFLVAGSDVVFVLILGSYFHSLGVENSGWLGLGVLVSLPLWGGAAGGIFGGFINDWAIRRFGSRRWGRSLVAFTGLAVGGGAVLLAVASANPIQVAMGLMVAKFFGDWAQPTVWGTCTDMGGRYSATVFGFGNMVGNLGAFSFPFVIGPLLDYYSVVSVVGGETVRETNFAPAFFVCGLMMLTAASCWLFLDCSKPIVPPEYERQSAETEG